MLRIHHANAMTLLSYIDEYPYLLESYYYLKDNLSHATTIIPKLNQCKHAIIDSGLFTMMFGADKDKVITRQDIWDYTIKYCDFINNSGYSYSFVEMDVQKLFDADFAWELRKYIRKRCKNNYCINVYHLEDGVPDKLIDFSDYIAISMPELRIHLNRDDMIRRCDYIVSYALRKKKRIHLLGTTEESLLQRYNDCFSSDSTTWRFKANDLRSKSHMLNDKPLLTGNVANRERVKAIIKIHSIENLQRRINKCL